MFDIVDFYPSITEELLSKCLRWAESFIDISDIDYRTIIHSRRTLLYDHKNTTWTKRDGIRQFDVSMGAYDGAEVCELVGLYVLKQLKEKTTAEIGLYRDDGLAVLKGTGRTTDKIRKIINEIFKDIGLKITSKCNLKVVDYLDITLNLNTQSYEPYRKPNDEPLYINIKSNHPPNIIKHIPDAVSKRLSTLSSNNQIFDKAAPTYNKALSRSGYKNKIVYSKEQNTENDKKKRNRTRKIIWFNPPYSLNVKTNVGRSFLNLIKKHFPEENKLHEIFNKNSVKVS